MRIIAVYIPDEDWPTVSQWVECDHAENWMEEEHLFYNPSKMFEMRLRLMGYEIGDAHED